MVDLICMGYVELPGTGTKPELQSNKTIVAHSRIGTPNLPLTKKTCPAITPWV